MARGINPSRRVPPTVGFRSKGFKSIKVKAPQCETFPGIHVTCIFECQIKSNVKALEIHDGFSLKPPTDSFTFKYPCKQNSIVKCSFKYSSLEEKKKSYHGDFSSLLNESCIYGARKVFIFNLYSFDK